jgi:hypothetical protein
MGFCQESIMKIIYRTIFGVLTLGLAGVTRAGFVWQPMAKATIE